jgi:hypothetical protein
MDWRGLIRIGGDFDLLGIESLPIPLNPYGLSYNRTWPWWGLHFPFVLPACDVSVVSASTVLLVHGQQLMCIAHWAGGSQSFPALAILVLVSAPCETSAGYRLPAKEGGNALLRHLGSVWLSCGCEKSYYGL